MFVNLFIIYVYITVYYYGTDAVQLVLLAVAVDCS